MAYTFNNAYTINETNLDQICNNTRNRASTANPLGVNWMMGIGTPTSTAPGANNSTALTAANLGVGIVVISPSTTALTFTTDTATNIVQYIQNNSAGVQVGDVLTCLVVNGSANAFTVGFGTNVTKDANVSATMPANTSRMFYFRVTNATQGSEAAYQ
jgi:hypothetical protein